MTIQKTRCTQQLKRGSRLTAIYAELLRIKKERSYIIHENTLFHHFLVARCIINNRVSKPLFQGETNRIIAQHALNKRSSRSHCVFTIYIESHSRVESNTKYVTSKLNFVDLAGSERLGKTLSVGETQVEAMYINKSLTFLEQAVIALSDRRRDHVPFRQSKLTHVLKDSIGGKCNTLLIANIWGEAEHIEETVKNILHCLTKLRLTCIFN